MANVSAVEYTAPKKAADVCRDQPAKGLVVRLTIVLQTGDVAIKKIGMIGGLGWPSTVDYYRLLCTKTNEHFKENGAAAPYAIPQIVIESLNMNETRKLRGQEGDEASWSEYDSRGKAKAPGQ